MLIDLDGVIYQSGQIIPGAVEALDWIKQQQIPHLYVTNTTSRSRAALVEKFTRLGFSAGIDEIVTPIVAASQWLNAQGIQRAALFVPAESQQDFVGIESIPLQQETSGVEAVIIGDLGTGWTFDLLNRAFRFLMQSPQPRLLALGMTRYWRAANGLQLDVAPFIKALEHAASCEAVVVGKPAAAFFGSALELLGCATGSTYMVGDDIRGDVDAAQRCGLRGIQVKTGKFRPEDLNGDIEPSVVLDSFAELPQWWSGSNSR